jgi:hypothetical protein
MEDSACCSLSPALKVTLGALSMSIGALDLRQELVQLVGLLLPPR